MPDNSKDEKIDLDHEVSQYYYSRFPEKNIMIIKLVIIIIRTIHNYRNKGVGGGGGGEELNKINT